MHLGPVVTAHSIPRELERRDGNLGEWDVWDRLRRELPDGTTLCGVKVPQGPSGRQIDILVLWPDVGIAVIEVKGHPLRLVSDLPPFIRIKLRPGPGADRTGAAW